MLMRSFEKNSQPALLFVSCINATNMPSNLSLHLCLLFTHDSFSEESTFQSNIRLLLLSSAAKDRVRPLHEFPSSFSRWTNIPKVSQSFGLLLLTGFSNHKQLILALHYLLLQTCNLVYLINTSTKYLLTLSKELF